MLMPVWDVVAVEQGAASPAGGEQVVIIGGTAAQRAALQRHVPAARLLDVAAGAEVETLQRHLRELGAIDHLIWVAPAGDGVPIIDDAVIAAQEHGVLQCFRLFKALSGLGYGGKAFAWTLITTQTQAVRRSDAVDPRHAAVHGFAGSLAKEYGHWMVRLIDLPAQEAWPVAELLRLPADRDGSGWGYRGGEWYRQRVVPGEVSRAAGTLYRRGGVYVVIGGAGGLGEAWSEYMIGAYGAQIVWIGRRSLDAAIEAKLDRLSGLGPRPLYLCADASDRAALQAACEEVRRYGQIHGVIHSAIVLQDKSLQHMSESTFRAALSAKVDVSVRLAQVFAGAGLDFVLFFSSLQSVIRAAGQSNYAAGCTFKDAFGRALGSELACPVKIMNWGYWGSTGVVARAEYRARMAAIGVGAIEAAEGMAALEVLLSGPHDQLGLVKSTGSAALSVVAADERLHIHPRQTMPIAQVLGEHKGAPVPAAALALRAAEAGERGALLERVWWGELRRMGLGALGGGTFAAIKHRLGVIDLYDRWLEASLSLLVQRGRLGRAGDIYTVVPDAPDDGEADWQAWEMRRANWLAHPDLVALVHLEEQCLRALPDVLSGRRRATDVLFPGGSMALVEGVYRNNVVADYFNDGIADLAVALVEARLAQAAAARIRIVEVGAGTGGTSAGVFARLRPYREHIAEYCYTDVSQAFLTHARERYGAAAPYLEARVLDIERPIAGQGFEPGSYDVVIAANVLHATRNIRRSLRNVKALLRCDGVLLLNELSEGSLSQHVTFGLLEGWWRYEDAALRIEGSPALSAQTWRRVLAEEGYGSILLPLTHAHELGQQVVVAASDGVVRQGVQRRSAPKRAPSDSALVAVQAADSPAVAPPLSVLLAGALTEKAQHYFKKTVASVLRLPMDRLDIDAPLESYGIDSILVMQLTKELEKSFGSLSKTLLFEHQTLRSLVGYFLVHHRDRLMPLLGGVKTERAPSAVRETRLAEGSSPRRARRQRPAISLQSGSPAKRDDGPLDVAIIGVAGRYPGARDLTELWANLRDGKDCIREVPKARWNHDLYFDEDKDKPGKTYSKWGGFIAGVDEFDPLFFGISPREAETIDPQERLFLQQAYACIEDAGYLPRALSADQQVGVFVGVMNCHYRPGAHYWSIANRVSYSFDFKGPSIAVDSACSSSLTALHLAVESLRSGSSDCALAGGVSLIVAPAHYLALSSMTMLSAGKECRAFGAGADGLIDGEGVGAVLLKPLARAKEDGDQIYGVIRATAVNHGGKTNGYTVPNPVAQGSMIERALQQAGVDARAVSYIEAHGTGTSLGDPIEIAGLTRAFRRSTADTQFCAIGSVKSNIGHCESAAGIAGVTKVLLQMRHGQLAPSLHAEVLNPRIDFANSPFVVQRSLAEWRRPVVETAAGAKEHPRIAGVSSFGAGGSNAHVVIEEYVGPARPTVTVAPAAIVLSAKNEARLRERAEQLVAAINARLLTDADLGDVAFTLQVGREAMEARLGLLAGSMAEVLRKLQAYLAGEEGIEDFYRGEVKRNKEALTVLAADDDMAQTIEAWVAKGKYGKLLDLWVKGLTFDWRGL